MSEKVNTMEKVINVKKGTPVYNHIMRICDQFKEPKFKWDGTDYVITKVFPATVSGHISVRLKS